MAIILFLPFNEVVAQSNHILVVNKTNCDLHVWAYCTLDEEDCEWANLNYSNQITVAANSTYLLTDVNSPVTGCEGEFALIRFNFQGSPGTHLIRFTYLNPTCEPPDDCDWVADGYTYANIEEQCMGESGRIQGVYHANPSGGSNCHMVFDYGQ